MFGASLGQKSDQLPFVSTRFMLFLFIHCHFFGRKRQHLQQIRNPKCIEQISGADFFLAVILPEIKKLENVSMPWFEVDRKCSRTLVASLIDVTGSGIIRT